MKSYIIVIEMTLEEMAMEYYTEENSIESLVRYYLSLEQIKEWNN